MLPKPPGVPIGPFLPLKEKYQHLKIVREWFTIFYNTRSLKGLTTKENEQELREHALTRTLRYKNHSALYFHKKKIICVQIDNLWKLTDGIFISIKHRVGVSRSNRVSDAWTGLQLFHGLIKFNLKLRSHLPVFPTRVYQRKCVQLKHAYSISPTCSPFDPVAPLKPGGPGWPW